MEFRNSKGKKLWSIDSFIIWQHNQSASMNMESRSVPRNRCLACDKISHSGTPFCLRLQATNSMITEYLRNVERFLYFLFLLAF